MHIRGKVRNVKKFNNGNSKGCIQETKLRSLGLGKYEFPTYDKVPGGWYFSEIKEAKWIVSKAGKDALEVYYKIEDAGTIYKIVNGRLPDTEKIKTYYIKQIYIKGSPRYNTFVDSMAEELKCVEFEVEDVLGITEHAKLVYDQGDIGGFRQRNPFKREWYHESEEAQEDEMYEEYEERQQNIEETELQSSGESASAVSDDNDFDDFLDDIDEW